MPKKAFETIVSILFLRFFPPISHLKNPYGAPSVTYLAVTTLGYSHGYEERRIIFLPSL